MEVYKMKRKIISILVIFLLIAIMPSMSTATVAPTQDAGKLWLRGIIQVSEVENNTVHAYAIRLHYLKWNATELTKGTVFFLNVTFPDAYLIITIGEVGFVIGISTGGLEHIYG